MYTLPTLKSAEFDECARERHTDFVYRDLKAFLKLKQLQIYMYRSYQCNVAQHYVVRRIPHDHMMLHIIDALWHYCNTWWRFLKDVGSHVASSISLARHGGFVEPLA